ncbi:MAG: ATP-dependent zinc protease family protein [Vibrio litoralis]|uniref:ATP-dependent zinc protease family protein n=1 Tax=Vibrio litoralis TaxID=335972 RepID=UPI003F9D81E3
MKFSQALLTASLFIPLSSLAVAAEPQQDVAQLLQDKIVVGEKEWVTVLDTDQRTIAKIDTGATTSSINAIDIHDFEKDGKDMVLFKIKAKDDVSKEITLPVKRWVHIKQSSSPETSRRPIVELDIKLGDKTYTTPFNLVDRDHMINAILIGRSFLDPIALVDVEQKYIHKKKK